MSKLVGLGGLHVRGETLRELESDLNELCGDYGFPDGEEFKWSPSKRHWMQQELIADLRQAFFCDALMTAKRHGAKALLVVADAQHRPATRAAETTVADVTMMLLERANVELVAPNRDGVVVVDRPGGGANEETRFLASCLEMLRKGSAFVKPDRIAINVLTTPSHLVRLLQLADVVASCGVSYIGGEERFSPPVFEVLRTMFHRGTFGIGGVGVKLHPDFNYLNLYHWLLGDAEHLDVRDRRLFQLPDPTRPYPNSPTEWR